jgi:hypothetical protein
VSVYGEGTNEPQGAPIGDRNMKRAIETTSTPRAILARAVTAQGQNTDAAGIRNDPMRRFVPTPYSADLPVMRSTVRLETNSSKLLEHMIELFTRYPGEPTARPQFVWRIVVDADVRCGPPWPRRSTFSDGGLRFAQFGERNFLAVDIDAREAIAFVAEGLLEDAPGFTSPFIDTLFYMTAGSLGLVPFAAACVSSGMKGLLVLGPPNQGKTTASYLAVRGGLTYHADQSVFLEVADHELRAWGDFVPIAFRPETLQFLPELSSRTLPFSYCDFNFYYMAKDKPDSEQLGFVIPSCCVVLERESSTVPRLSRIAKTELSTVLSKYIAFKDDDRFEEQRLAVLAALGQLPAYHLAYDSDPANATPYLRYLLNGHDPQGSSRSDGCS